MNATISTLAFRGASTSGPRVAPRRTRAERAVAPVFCLLPHVESDVTNAHSAGAVPAGDVP
ncbi:hypothetical protein OB2597_05925 [Pseudooceanicola batsensis HTCC2597]|uniref:Uncharacterized protein n=1 Tax=Pseudooceanicola batsensis (strain ATCC BAA-863 / DSM 15984 / KCTC 12145 / HTCC2597) TaxID=252305 RepID=A3TT20_PSEBH|nr:hypothetical protein OB2597_05925 [Pseudooceanicola batsensis HTCC2597]